MKTASARELGEFLGIDERTVRKYVGLGIIVRSGYGKYAIKEFVE